MDLSSEFEAFRSGDTDAFRMIFERYYKALFLFAQGYLSDQDEVEDLLQEVFVMLWEKKGTLRDRNALSSFLYSSVRNRALNVIRHKKVIDAHQKLEGDEAVTEEFYAKSIIDTETYRILLAAIEELPEQTRKVSQLSLNGLKNAEIALQLEISTSTVKYHKKQALDILRKYFDGPMYILLLILFA